MPIDRTVVEALTRLAAFDKSNFETTLEETLRVGAELVGVDWIGYWSLLPDMSAIHCDMAYDRANDALYHGATLRESDYPRYFAELRRAEPIRAPDCRVDPRTSELARYFDQRRIGSLFDVPIRLRATLVGVLCCERAARGTPWIEAHAALGICVGQVVATALEARSRTHAEEEARRAVLLDHASLRLSASLGIDEVVDRALSLLVPELAEFASIFMGGPERIRLMGRRYDPRLAELVAAVDQARELVPDDEKYVFNLAVARCRESIRVPVLGQSALASFGVPAGVREHFRDWGPFAALGIPLLFGDRVLGTVTLIRPRPYEAQESKLGEAVAQRIANALEHARLFQDATDAVRARDDFVSLVAHELHTPLTSLGLAAEALAERDGGHTHTTVERMSQLIVRQAGRLNRLVDAMLDASNIGAGHFAVDREEVDLSEVVREQVEVCAPRLSKVGSTIALDIEGPLVGWYDRLRIEGVVASLLDNAVKFSGGKPIEVSARRDAGEAVVRVRDHGVGIAPEQLQRTWEPYQRAWSTRSYGGLGLALHVARTTVAAHGGTISVESRVGEGTTFTVRVPLQRPHRREPETGAEDRETAPQ